MSSNSSTTPPNLTLPTTSDAAVTPSTEGWPPLSRVITHVIEVPRINYQETFKEFDPPGRPKEVTEELRCPKITEDIVQEEVSVEVEKLVEKVVPVPIEYTVEKIEEEIEWEEKVLYKEVVQNEIIEKPVYQEKYVDVYKTFQRNIPAPMEVVCGWKFRVPRVCSVPKIQRLTYYVPRFVEVPILSIYIKDEEYQEAVNLYAMMQRLASSPAPSLADVVAVAEMAKKMQEIVGPKASENAAVSALGEKLRRHLETAVPNEPPAVVQAQ